MQVHIDKAGRLVLPKSVRQQLGLTPDTALDLVPGPDGVLLRPIAEKPSMRQLEGLWAHQGVAPGPADWSRVVDSVRDERANSAWTA